MPNPHQIIRLGAYLTMSITLSRKVRQVEHRANPFLNILNETAKSKAQYPDLLKRAGTTWRVTNSVLGAGVTLLRSIRYWPNAVRFNAPIHPAEIVIISHLTTADHLANNDDFYMGDLAASLEEAGHSTKTILINHCHATDGDLKRSMRKNTILLPAFLHPLAEVGLIFKMLLSAFSLPKFATSTQARQFRRNARIAQLSSRAIGDMRIGSMLSYIISAAPPKAIFYTYEGHGWERIMAANAHSLSADIKLLGYQHAVVFPGEKSINYAHGGGADPDHIFTAGTATQKILVGESDFPASFYSTIGSVKVVSTSRNISPASFAQKSPCLIAPEGTLSEVMIMAKMGIAAAKSAPEQKFILRLHPVLNRKFTMKKLASLGSVPDNFTLSTASLEDDLAASSWLCYRGSTVAFQAILAGLRPIYLDPDHQADANDPIPKDISFRKFAALPSDLMRVIIEDQQSDASALPEFQDALAFAQNYVTPFKPLVLITYLKKIFA